MNTGTGLRYGSLGAFLVVWIVLSTVAGAQAGCDPTRFSILVDAGHGPRRAGAESARGLPEYAFNTRLAARVVAALQTAGFGRAALLDPVGLDLSPAGRAARANARDARLLLSIHHDSVQPHYLSTWTVEGKTRRYCDRFAGYSLFYSGKNPKVEASLELARDIGRALRQAGLVFTRHHTEAIPGENRPMVDETVGVSRYDGLAVLAGARMPAVLVEAGVIVNREEEEALSRPERIETTAKAIAQGVVSYCRQNKP
jgi:N-acetylmuramoyl-L-alanine amidase